MGNKVWCLTLYTRNGDFLPGLSYKVFIIDIALFTEYLYIRRRR